MPTPPRPCPLLHLQGNKLRKRTNSLPTRNPPPRPPLLNPQGNKLRKRTNRLPTQNPFPRSPLLSLQGNKLRKYGRRGKPKEHVFRLSQDLQELQWDSSNVRTDDIKYFSVGVLAWRVCEGLKGWELRD